MRILKILGLALVVSAFSLAFFSLHLSEFKIAQLASFLAYMSVACTIIPLPTPPYAIAMGKEFHPMLVAFVGAFGNCIAAFLEYKLLMRLFSIPSLMRRIEASRLFGLFRRLGQTTMFGALLLGGFTPVPFEPFRLAAILLRYHLGKFLLAVFLARYLHYYLIALLGRVFHIPDTWLGILIGMMFLAAAWDIFKAPAKPNERPV